MIVPVALAERSYNVLIDEAGTLPEALAARFPGKRRFVILTNETLAVVCASRIDAWREALDAEICTIRDGEVYKTIETWTAILDFLLSSRCDRSTVLVAVGGGVVGDIGGFAAAAFLRGIDFVQVPTTLLAMVDSSVGGKTAVNHPMGKNMIGAFHQPRLVWVETATLSTLSMREFVAGYAEVFKNACIGGREMFDFIVDNHARILARDPDIVRIAVQRSVAIKAGVVSADEKESGLRALLNLGHTFGHALEHHYHFSGILHGEGVFWGIGCAIALSKRLGLIPHADLPAYDLLMHLLPIPRLPQPLPSVDELHIAMFSDKKTVGGAIKFILPTKPGTSIIYDGASENDVKAVMREALTIA